MNQWSGKINLLEVPPDKSLAPPTKRDSAQSLITPNRHVMPGDEAVMGTNFSDWKTRVLVDRIAAYGRADEMPLLVDSPMITPQYPTYLCKAMFLSHHMPRPMSAGGPIHDSSPVKPLFLNSSQLVSHESTTSVLLTSFHHTSCASSESSSINSTGRFPNYIPSHALWHPIKVARHKKQQSPQPKPPAASLPRCEGYITGQLYAPQF